MEKFTFSYATVFFCNHPIQCAVKNVITLDVVEISRTDVNLHDMKPTVKHRPPIHCDWVNLFDTQCMFL